MFIVLVILVVELGLVNWAYSKQKAVKTLTADKGIPYNFICDKNKSIKATFYPNSDTKVDLVLSDGRIMSLAHVMSGSGARYANGDESIVFWNKGNTAFMTEKDKTTFDGCVEK